MSAAPAKPEALPEPIAKESPLEEAKAGPAVPGTPLPLEKPIAEKPIAVKPALETKPAEPALASGEKLPAGDMTAHGGVESQNRFVPSEGVHSKAADGQISSAGVVAGKDAAEVARGEGGGAGGRMAIEKKLDQSKVIAADQPPTAPSAPSPVAAPAAAAAPMSAPALSLPPLSSQKAGESDVVAAKMGGGQVAAVISLNCTVAAARDGTFRRLLSENGIATTAVLNNSLNNYGQQSLARYQNLGAENGSLSPGGVQMPLAGTASRGSTGRQQQGVQQQAVQQQSPSYNQARRRSRRTRPPVARRLPPILNRRRASPSHAVRQRMTAALTTA